ncbi:MAG: protein archease [Amphiamblys sp. WSBS2006]|nr:MAG: protein archease [Amphiamblys sp. WSBS2006]
MEAKYEYMDHPADIKIHSWGASVEESFAGAVLATVRCMASPNTETGETETETIAASGNTLEDLLFQTVEEIIEKTLFDGFVTHSVAGLAITQTDSAFALHAELVGAQFSEDRHRRGLEVKAMTYSDLSLSSTAPFDCYFIVDV